MATTTPTVGMVLFLRPEDVVQDVDAGYYALVTAVSDAGVLVEPIGRVGAAGSETISSRVALLRQVPDEEPTGTRASMVFRKGVACHVPEGVRFGQAVMTSDLGVQVDLGCGTRWLPRNAIICEVHPLMAMLMYEFTMRADYWTQAFIAEAELRLAACVDGSGPMPPTWDSVLEAIAPSLSMNARVSEHRRWYEMKTGKLRVTTISHAIMFTFYVENQCVIPVALRPSIGESIAADPTCVAAASVASDVQPASKRQRVGPSYLASDTSYDDQEESPAPGDIASGDAFPAVLASDGPSSGAIGDGVRRTLRMRASNAADSGSRAIRALAPSSVATGMAVQFQGEAAEQTLEDAEADLLQRLENDPDSQRLFRRLMAATGRSAPPRMVSDSGRRERSAFNPHEAQVLLHEAISPPAAQGTSGTTFVHRLLSSSAVTFIPYPAVLMLLYEFGFGPRGLSVMHLRRVSVLERMRLQRETSTNMVDFSAKAKLPDAQRPTSWAELQDGVNGLVAYCNSYADAATAKLALTVSGFVTAMQAFGHWPVNHLDALEYWINEQLGAYRELVDSEVRYGTANRADALAWFSPTNPTLVPLQNLMLQQDMVALQAAASGAVQHSALPKPGKPHGGSEAPRVGVPTSVKTAIPRKNGHELCLRFASKKGCKSSASTCGGGEFIREHFVAPTMPKEVRAFIITKFGGLSTDYHDKK